MDLFPLNHVLELNFGHIWEQLISPVIEVANMFQDAFMHKEF